MALLSVIAGLYYCVGARRNSVYRVVVVDVFRYPNVD